MSVNNLVGRLSKAEKRHFKQYSRLNSKKNVPKYVKLFNATDKNFLGNKIIESLDLIQINLSLEQEVLQNLKYFPFLFEKNLQTELNSRLRRSEKICKEYDLMELELLIIDCLII